MHIVLGLAGMLDGNYVLYIFRLFFLFWLAEVYVDDFTVGLHQQPACRGCL
jgi:hypothetical protein